MPVQTVQDRTLAEVTLCKYSRGASYENNAIDRSVNFTAWLITHSVVRGHLQWLKLIHVALRLSRKSCLQRCYGMFEPRLTSNFHQIIAPMHASV
jgi:hypothetical protein